MKRWNLVCTLLMAAMVFPGCGTSAGSGGGAAGIACVNDTACPAGMVCSGGYCAAGSADAADTGGKIDAGKIDAGEIDAGKVDAGKVDTGSPADTGVADTGTPDTGTPDTGTLDTGTPDTGTPDTGTPDTGVPDTGTSDTGTADAGADTQGTTMPPPGCGAASDQQVMATLNSSSVAAAQAAQLVSDCTLKKGCLGKATDTEKKNCISQCIYDGAKTTPLPLSLSCARCFGEFKGFCGASKCIAQCAANPSSATCTSCLSVNCDPKFNACVAVNPGGPSSAPGCTSSTDQQFLVTLGNSSSLSASMAQVVADCTLKQGCLNKTTAQDKKDCISTCVASSSIAKTYNVSKTCSACFGEFKGYCGFEKCLGQCATNPGSQSCATCLATNCDPAYEACLKGQ